jgi:hypothetical protein
MAHPGQPAIAHLAWNAPSQFEAALGSARERTRAGGGIFLLPDATPRLRAGFLVAPEGGASPVVVDAGRELAGVGLINPTARPAAVKLNCPQAQEDAARPRCSFDGLPSWRISVTRLSPDETRGGDGQHFRFFLNVTDARGYPLVATDFHAGNIEHVAQEGGRLLLLDHHGIWRELIVERPAPERRLAPLFPRRADPQSNDPRARVQTPACTDYDCVRLIQDSGPAPAGGRS